MNSNDLQVFKVLSNGRASTKPTDKVNTGVVQNVFPHVRSSQRKTGMTDYAVTAWRLLNTDNLPLLDPESYQDGPTLSPDDYVVMCVLTPRIEQSGWGAAIEAADKFGSAVLKTAITAGDSTATVTVRHANLLPGGVDDIFRDGLVTRFCSHTDALSSDGAEEDKTISGTPTYSGLDVTMTFTESFTNDFAAGTRVSSLIVPGVDIAPAVASMTVVSSGGAVDSGSYPLLLDNGGTPEEDFVLEFTDATHFTVTGDTRGVIGSGVIGTEFVAVNADNSRPMFTIEVGFFTGTFVAGDTVSWTTHGAELYIGQKRKIEQNAASLANNTVSQVYGGEAAA